MIKTSRYVVSMLVCKRGKYDCLKLIFDAFLGPFLELRYSSLKIFNVEQKETPKINFQ